MVKTHKRSKNSRIRGARTCGWGFRQKHKGHGNKGGVGMAGSGKRADHKKQKALEMDKKKKTYFGGKGLTSRSSKRVHIDKINLSTIKENLLTSKANKIDLTGYVILGNGEGFKCEIIAKKASKAAIEKMNAAGGKITLVGVKEEKPKAEVKEE